MSLSTPAQHAPVPRTKSERRKRNDGPPSGVERRVNDADRRTENNEEYVSFYIDNQLLGIAVLKVQEVLPMQAITPIPRATRALAGLLNLRGQIVTAIDLRIHLGLPPHEHTDATMSVIVESGGELFSLLVDAVGDVIPVARHKFSTPPATLAQHWRQCCEGVYQLQRGLLVVLDVKSLLNQSAHE